MLARLIDMLSRRSRQPLALGVLLVSARGGEDPRPVRFAQMRPASAWSCVLSVLVALGLGIMSVERDASPSSAPATTLSAGATAVKRAAEASVARFTSGSHPGSKIVTVVRRS